MGGWAESSASKLFWIIGVCIYESLGLLYYFIIATSFVSEVAFCSLGAAPSYF